jgi:hypothetical protein
MKVEEERRLTERVLKKVMLETLRKKNQPGR